MVLKPTVPQTQKEQVEYSLAAERRRVRMLHDDIIKDLLSHGSIQQGRTLIHQRIQITMNAAVSLIKQILYVCWMAQLMR